MATQALEPVYTAQLFAPLHAELVALLRGLDQTDWKRPTLAGSWTVHDVAAHLLDGDLRKLSAHRDGAVPSPDAPELSFRDLVALINSLNREGVRHFGTMSSRVIVDLLEVTGRWVCEFVDSLDPHARAVYPVAWAGEAVSENWMDTGREYTERWHHQMQIRDAVAAPVLYGRMWLRPVLQLSVRAFPTALADVGAGAGTSAVYSVSGEGGGTWSVCRRGSGWEVLEGEVAAPQARIDVDEDTAWRMFFNALTPKQRSARVAESGDTALTARLLAARAVMV
jgi:hypothetical protein